MAVATAGFWRGLDGGVFKWQGTWIRLCCRLGQPLESLMAVAEVPSIREQLHELPDGLHCVLLKMAVALSQRFMICSGLALTG